MQQYKKSIIAALIGGALGFAYYYFIGCKSGACPITSNPFISIGYGMVIGFLLTTGKKKPQKQD